MTDIKNLKPTEIYVYPKTFNEAVECFALFEKMGFEKDIYEPCSNASFFIGENRISYWYEKLPELTEITLYELRQMAGVEESKPDELAALRKENEELRERLEYYERLAKSAEEIYRAYNSDVDMIMTPIRLISGSDTLEDLKP